MSDLMREINSIAARFREIDRQVEEVRKTKEYMTWFKAPFPKDRQTETRDVQVTLWKGTPKEEKFTAHLTKMYATSKEY